MAHILVVDDELSMRDFLGIILRKGGHRVSAASGGEQALTVAAEDPPDLVLQDLKMPGMHGTELLQRLKAKTPDLPVIVMTAFSTWDTTVEAMRLGAYDYVKKPFDNDEIRDVVERAITHRRLSGKAEARPELPALREVVGNSPPMREALDVARRVAATEATVLLMGESGTGKELFARILHYHSARAQGAFIGVNCGAFPEALLESELFGHARGSFTGAHADKRGLLQLAEGGTFFLDEVGELPLSMQVRLLRVLEERQFYPVGGTKPVRIDVRFVCATNRDLAEEVRRGAFRGDLYFRLNVVPVRIPPLRERPGDVPLLAGYFVRKYAAQLGRPITGIAPAVQARLEAYPWPGNVRELENAIQRAIALSRGSVIDDVQLSDAVFGGPQAGLGLAPGAAAGYGAPPRGYGAAPGFPGAMPGGVGMTPGVRPFSPYGFAITPPGGTGYEPFALPGMGPGMGAPAGYPGFGAPVTALPVPVMAPPPPAASAPAPLPPESAVVADAAAELPEGAPGAADVRLAPPLPPVPDAGMDLEATLAAIERRYLEDALARTDGNLTKAADLLRISFRSIRYKVKKLGIRA